MSDKVIQIENLNRTYNVIEGKKLISKQQIFHDLHFYVNEGEFIAVVGPSGCGKSTLLNIIGTLDSIGNKKMVKILNNNGDKESFIPEIEGSGTVMINNHNINTLKGNTKAEFINKNIGFIFQFHHLIPELTAIQNVALPMRIQGKSKRESISKAYELLEEMNLHGHANRKPDILSGGEKQRVAIARSLINSPKILLADEPTGSLHPDFKKGIIDLFIKLNKEKQISIVMVTHDVNSLYDKSNKLIIDRLFPLSDAPINNIINEQIT